MATLDDVSRIALGLPEVTEEDARGRLSWAVAGKTFAWERPYSKADLKRFGDETPPRQPILAVRVEDLVDKEAVLATGTKGIFTIPHFDGYSAVLVQQSRLGEMSRRELEEIITDAWATKAPKKLVKEHLG